MDATSSDSLHLLPEGGNGGKLCTGREGVEPVVVEGQRREKNAGKADESGGARLVRCELHREAVDRMD